jgi:hypothetical protein
VTTPATGRPVSSSSSKNQATTSEFLKS